tara:strand:- start:109 stop:381 length:273 start_codon:yes stop_codon:yes gene_type:complete
VSLRPKFDSQLPILEQIDHFFHSKIKYRKMLLKDKNKNTDEIKRIDIALAYYIKKRAKVTKGGFNFIPKEMWEWQPIFEIDSSLLPKIKR